MMLLGHHPHTTLWLVASRVNWAIVQGLLLTLPFPSERQHSCEKHLFLLFLHPACEKHLYLPFLHSASHQHHPPLLSHLPAPGGTNMALPKNGLNSAPKALTDLQSCLLSCTFLPAAPTRLPCGCSCTRSESSLGTAGPPPRAGGISA